MIILYGQFQTYSFLIHIQSNTIKTCTVQYFISFKRVIIAKIMQSVDSNLLLIHIDKINNRRDNDNFVCNKCIDVFNQSYKVLINFSYLK